MISIGKLQAHTAAAVGKDPILLGDMIARAVGFVQTQTRRYFGPISETTEYLSGNGGRHLYLSEKAIPDEDYGDLILIEERAYPGGTPTEILIADYQVRHGKEASDPSYLVRLGGGVWTRGLEYAVTYERGYGEDAGPADIEALIIDLIEDRLELMGEEVLQSETIGGYSYTRFKDSDVSLIDGGPYTIKSWRPQVLA